MLAAFLNNNLPYERTIMNSKMTLTAVLVASLFATQAQATVADKSNTIYSSNGYLETSDEEFAKALAHSYNPENNQIPGLVKLNIYGGNSDVPGYGTMSLTLNSKDGYKADHILFTDASGIKKNTHQAKLTLNGTSLILTKGITIQNATASEKKEDVSKLPSEKDLVTVGEVTLNNKTILSGNVINRYTTYTDDVGDLVYVGGLTNQTRVDLVDASLWVGDLVDEVNATVDKNKIKGQYIVSLKDGSSWVGGVSVAENSTTEVMLDASSSWTVNKDSKVNTIKFDGAAREAAKQGVVLAQDVTLTIANGTEASTIANLKSEAGSALAVEKTTVTIANTSGNTNVVLNEKANVTVNAATDKVTAKFNSLEEGTKFTTADNVKADVEVSGKLVDAKGMNAVIEEFNKNQSYEGKGTVLFSGGLMANDVIGHMGDKGFVQTGSKTNANLVSIGESTAVTMMQWRADADDMAQRMGELRNNDGAVGLWARTYGGKAEADHVSNKYNGIQVGADTQIGAEGVKHFVGGAFSYTKGDADFVNGSGDNYIASLTGYSTWIYEGGSYLDVSAKWGKLTNDFDIGLADTKLAGKFNTHGVAMSVETGHRFPVGSLAYVEPQLAFTASHISGERYEANQGVTIEQDSIDSYVARVGVQAGLNCPDNVGSLFVRASYLYDFDGETSTTGRSAKNVGTFDQDFGGGWYELGVGMNVNFTKNFHGYADFEYVTGGEIKTPYRWNAGVRYTF